MNPWTPKFLRWFAGPRSQGSPGHLLPRWLFLRAMGIIYFSAFYSLAFQIRGLLGPDGLLPAGMYLQTVVKYFGASRYWYAPTLLWLDSSDRALMALCWIGMVASFLLFLNLWPRAMLLICFVLFLSFVTAAQDFSGYQSDGMLLSAGFICLFFAPRGFRPRFRDFRSAIARQFVSAATALVLHLFRFRGREILWRRSFVARFHRDGSVLSKWAVTDLARLVCKPNAALVPRVCGSIHGVFGVGAGVDAVSASPVPHFLFLRGHVSAAQYYSDGQLRVSELPCSGSWRFASR